MCNAPLYRHMHSATASRLRSWRFAFFADRNQDLRSLMALLPPEELSVAGHAMALSQWHLAHQFCGRCGAPTVPAEAGTRRQCTANDSHRQVGVCSSD